MKFSKSKSHITTFLSKIREIKRKRICPVCSTIAESHLDPQVNSNLSRPILPKRREAEKCSGAMRLISQVEVALASIAHTRMGSQVCSKALKMEMLLLAQTSRMLETVQ